ncbi:hypothetical protein LEMA_P017970.1 [Plenodomus lingam JN3]|uniref:Cysteine dioxygenase n=1 Tax=Leptosphaeria maculans (strain JN3 / isolate v23.1.3 / race Av1-4-5-6-7-8) TaxID=985895 RepID=E5AAH6_LEPMJ|nr:hypothetical protein LEMA_P017970.1 [Plenodomus lingam JN3]CBY00667.1 hypothetical protein LEMA_P017970.1 [Plenodomus lingam JN3]
MVLSSCTMKRRQFADLWVDASVQETCRHSNAHCIMKVLKGSLQETRYDWPTVALNKGEKRPLDVISQKTYERDQVTYMSDKLGLHKIKNPHPTEYAVSLHLYTPPNAATYGCSTFDEKTGTCHRVNKCTFFSEYGQRIGANRP